MLGALLTRLLFRHHPTQEGYISAVKNISAFLGASRDTASAEDSRRYRLHLVASGAGVPSINHSPTHCGFFSLLTLYKPAILIDSATIRIAHGIFQANRSPGFLP